MNKDETRLSWLVRAFQDAHSINTSDSWGEVRHMVYAASQALLWHDNTHEAMADRAAYQFLGGICHVNALACIYDKFKEAA